MIRRPCLVAVVGKGRDCPTAVGVLAHTIGRMVADAGAVLLTGGLGGAMAGASAGAMGAGGTVIAVLPEGYDSMVPVTYPLRTGLSHTTRNVVMGSACDLLLALEGGPGTMQEVAVASERGIPMAQVATEQWSLDTLQPQEVPAWLSENVKATTDGISTSRSAGRR
jgi:hypothetical protein